MTIVGIDNGLDGGLVGISSSTGSIIDKTPMKTLERCGKREVDTYKTYQWILGLDVAPKDLFIAIEEPLRHARSSQAVRSMALSFGKLLGLCEIQGWRHRCVIVRDWQKSMLGKFNKGQSKQKAFEIASNIEPLEKWLKSSRATKPHDGMIDAFLIAHYIKKYEFNFS
tara:strand:+ start:30621 stop:31124 length:504 start_codon:yes stop_codon:yes gene_type:complete